MDHHLISELEAMGGEILPASLNGCDEIIIEQPSFSARIALWGGHLSSFIPNGEPDLLFQSQHLGGDARFSKRHFGVPICWPWFAANEDCPDLQTHGIARYFRWKLTEVGRFKNGDIKLVLKLASEDHPLIEDMWPQAFELRQVFRLGEGFQINFSAANLSDTPMKIAEALHTYFAVGDSQQTRVSGLDGGTYFDKLTSLTMVQQGDISPCVALDRVYTNAPPCTYVEDPVFNRRLEITSEGSESTVVWNPGKEIAQARKDMNDDDFHHFVCVESANVLDNGYLIDAGGMHQLKLKVIAQPLNESGNEEHTD